MLYDYMTLDVFTDQAFGGNQLAVLTDARGIDAVADRHDLTGALGTGDERQRHRVQAGAVVDVDVVDADATEADEHLTGPRLRVGHVLEREHLGTAGLMDTDRLHTVLPSHVWPHPRPGHTLTPVPAHVRMTTSESALPRDSWPFTRGACLHTPLGRSSP